MKNIFKLPGILLGRLSYSPPPWMSAINRFRKNKPTMFWTLVIILLAVFMGTGYRLSMPGPVRVVAMISPPGPPVDEDDPDPDPLVIQFDYAVDDLKSDQPVPEGDPSVARIDLIRRPVAGIRMTPAFPGRWRWTDDRTLTFLPERAWPAGSRFRMDLPSSIFSPETRLKKEKIEFETPSFEASIDTLEFYQNPTDSAVRRVVATLFFSHPVDRQSLETRLSMTMRPSGEGMQTPTIPVGLVVDYDVDRRQAHISSDPVILPPQSNTLRLTVNQGVMPAAGGSPTTAVLSDTVLIPDLYSFLKVSEAKTLIVANKRQEPEQVLTLTFTDEIAEETLLQKLRVYLLPEFNHKRKNHYWESPREVTKQVLAVSERVALKVLPNERPASMAYHFVIDAPEHRYLYLRVDENLTSINGFVHAAFFDTVMATPVYPRQVQLAGEGSLLTYSGRHRLGVMARGLAALKIAVGRLLPGQITHLVTQTDGDIRDPYFSNPNFKAENIVDYSHEILDLKPLHPGKASYTSMNLSGYLSDGPREYGLFFVRVEGWDKERNQPVYDASDQRLILITDLGLMVKNNADGSHSLFVQSIKTGLPVSGAEVHLLGKNGLPLFRRITDANGHAGIPATGDFKAERQPSVYLVKSAADTAFIPFAGHSRQIELSRFDVGGVRGRQGRKGELNAFIFSDRGFYRPGETVHLGVIVKNSPLDNVSDIPLEVVIQGPRRNTLKTEKRILPQKGFFDISYTTAAKSNTGRYRVSLYLVRDNHTRDRLLGSVGFTVEEFIPDTMKITSTLVDAPARGWTTAEHLTARVELNNLFGTPARDHRVQARFSVQPAHFQFREFTDYRFFDPFTDATHKPLRLDEALTPATTDADGKTDFTIPLNRFREGTYQLDFFVEGFDPGGGRSVSEHNQTMISPLPHLVGFKSDGDLEFIHTGSDQHVDWIAIDASLTPLALSDLILKHLEIQHLSTLVKQPNGTFKYQTVDREKEIGSQPFAIAQGGNRYTLTTEIPGDYALEVHESGGARLARLSYTVVGHGNLTGRLEKEAILQLKLDKKDYQAGESIRMSITAPYVGAGIITIESDRVHAFKWFKTNTESTLETIRLPEDLEGNAYVSVSFVRDAGSREIFTSPLSTAVAPITIDRSRRRLDVVLNVDERVRPGKPMTIGYRTAQPSRVVVYAVDEGILQAAGYRTPKPLEHFLRKRALEVTTLQMLDLILPEYELIHELMASGGGAMREALAGNINPFARLTDTPAVFWSGILDGGPREQTVSFVVPDTFSGNLKVMAIAVGDHAVGTATEDTLVRGPFVLSPSVLLQAAPGDQFTATVGVANLVEGAGEKAEIDVSVIPSDNLEIVGAKTTRLTIDEGGEARAIFTVKARQFSGAASLTFVARLGDEEGRRKAGLSIRPAMPYRSTFSSGYEKDGSVALTLRRSLFPELAEQRVSASANPLVLVDALTAYLDHFPHGCTEQVVSQVFPLVGLLSHPAYGSNRADIERRFSVLTDRLRERQLANGGFSFWPGGRTAADFPSVYAMHFLMASRELGFAVPTDMLRRGIDYLGDVASRNTDNLMDAGVRAQAIYLLTLMGETTTNHLVHLQENLAATFQKEWKKDLAAVYMAATYRLLKMDADAERLVGHYQPGAVKSDGFDDFNRPLTRDAQVLYLLCRHFEKRARNLSGDELLRFIDPIFKGNTNTIGASYSILALGAYGQLNLPTDVSETVRFSLETVDGEKRSLESLPAPFPTATYGVDGKSVAMDGTGSLFYINVQSGFDRELPTEALRNGLEIYRDYTDAAGEVLDTFTQGQEVTVHLRVRSLKAPKVTNVAIVDLLPGGFEVIRRSVPRSVRGWQADYVDVREDRVIFYGSVDSSVRDLTYRVKVTAPGVFTVPPAFAESMYNRSLKASTALGRVTVTNTP